MQQDYKVLAVQLNNQIQGKYIISVIIPWIYKRKMLIVFKIEISIQYKTFVIYVQSLTCIIMIPAFTCRDIHSSFQNHSGIY
jgi:hypothetical protein